MTKITNLTNSPYELTIILPAQGSVDAEFAPAYLEMIQGLGYFEVSDTGSTAPAPDAETAEEEESEKPNEILTAIDLLDAADDKQWTNAGLPAVDAISALVGRTVTRAEINEVAPDFMRPTGE